MGHRSRYTAIQVIVLKILTSYPGDPTDSSVRLRPLEPASGQALARDLALKTRRRKGLGDQIAVSKYLDDDFVLALSSSGHADLLG